MKKVVLITGASSGMGKVTAKLLAAKGYVVYGAARRMARMDELKLSGIRTLEMDVTDDSSMVNGIKQIIAEQGRIDILINNAGFGSYGAVEEVSITDAKYQLDVNVFGAARLAQLVIPYMRTQHWGKIVNITSVGGKIVTPLGGWYHASKFALEGLSDGLRMEVKQFGIDVIIIEPGAIKTEWADIALNNAAKVSGNGPYKRMADKGSELMKTFDKRSSEPDVIAKLILKAISAGKPRTRYAGGFMAKPILFMRKILSDRMMDRIFMSQLK